MRNKITLLMAAMMVASLTLAGCAETTSTSESTLTNSSADAAGNELSEEKAALIAQQNALIEEKNKIVEEVCVFLPEYGFMHERTITQGSGKVSTNKEECTPGSDGKCAKCEGEVHYPDPTYFYISLDNGTHEEHYVNYRGKETVTVKDCEYNSEKVCSLCDYKFEYPKTMYETAKTMYAKEYSNLREGPSNDTVALNHLNFADETTVVGEYAEGGWYYLADGTWTLMSNLVDTKPEPPVAAAPADLGDPLNWFVPLIQPVEVSVLVTNGRGTYRNYYFSDGSQVFIYTNGTRALCGGAGIADATDHTEALAYQACGHLPGFWEK